MRSRRLWVEEAGRNRARAVTPCVGPLQRLRGHWDRASFGQIRGPAGQSIRRPAAIWAAAAGFHIGLERLGCSPSLLGPPAPRWHPKHTSRTVRRVPQGPRPSG